MFTLSVKQFGLRCASYFEAPIPYTEVHVADLALKVFTTFQTYGLQANQLKRIEGDKLFRYSLAFSMFNGNAQFDCDGERLFIEILNGQNAQDAALIVELLAKAHECLPSRDKSFHVMTAHCHAVFTDDKNSEGFFGRFRSVSDKVTFVRVAVESGEPKESLLPPQDRIKLEVEPSQVHQGGLFLAWRFNARGMIDEKFFEASNRELKALAAKLDIELAKQ